MNDVPNNCTVFLDGEPVSSEDFVAIIGKEGGDIGIYYDTDTLTLGLAIKLIAAEYVKCLKECTPTERQQIASVLGQDFMINFDGGDNR